MTRCKFRGWLLNAALPLWVGIAGLCVLGGCDKKAKGTGTATSPSASGSAGVAVAAGPCGNYAARLCEKAGPESATCQAIKTSTELMPPAACEAGLKDLAFSTKKLADATKSCTELVAKLCAAVGPKTQTCDMVTAQTKQFPPERCTQMLQRIPEIIGELKKMEQANQPLSADQQAAIAQGPAPSFGPENAKVSIVEFSDFQCPFCSRGADVVHQIRQKYGTKVHFVFRQFPLPMHGRARESAEAALAANAQGKFWEYHDLLFKNQQALERKNLEEHAKETGLDVAQFKKALDDHKFASTVESEIKLGETVAVQGTPTMFINGARVQNPTSFEAVSAMIETALKGSTPG
jgi:protein-disulfide isomerase